VAAYLKKIKAAHKLNVTFDYESELFVPIEDGEFVLVTSNGDRSDSIVLPRSPRLANRRDFYEFYQDYYHCAKPNVGELHIIEPAAVEAVDNGWKLQRSGVLEVIEDPHKAQSSNNGQQSLTPASSFVATAAAPALDNQPQKKRQVAVAPLRLAPDKHKEANNSDSAVDVRMAPCSHCGSLIEGEYAYCWKCGNPLCKDVKPTVRTKESPPARLLVVEDELDDEELTVQHDETAPRSAPFLWALAERTQQSQPLISSVLKLVAVGLIGVLLSVVFFLLTRSNSSAASVSTTESAASSGQLQQKAVTTQTPVDEPPSQTAVARPEDELKKLRKTRLEASSSDTSAIMPIFVNAEKQYPDDYRFPYERAKFAIAAASDRHAHDTAFAALSLAAGKAIKTGKAPEMLDSLLRDSEGDFHKLAHGHPEWVQLQQMLKSKDSRALNVKMGL
jgi:type II secretory pathway pseudopilin PulG